MSLEQCVVLQRCALSDGVEKARSLLGINLKA